MKTHLLIALFLLGFAAEFAIADTIPKDDAQKRTAETIVAFSADHDIGKAKAGYRAALKLDPNYAPARYGLGLMLEAEEDWKGARDAFQQVVDEEDRKVAREALQGVVRDPKRGSFSAAAKAELTTIEKVTNALKTPEGRKRLAYDDLIAQARLLLRSKQIPDAAKRAAEARKLDDSRWEAYMVAGEAMQAAGLMPEAMHFFNAASKRAPGLYKESLAGVAREWQAAEEEAALWKKIESGNDKSAMETYLIRYPSGRHFAEASAMLKSINEREERAKAERQRQQAEEAAAKQRQEAERQRQEAERQRQQAEMAPGNILKDCANCPEVVVISAGSFDMGTGNGHAKPIHRVTFSKPFAIGKTEVTQGQWKAIMGNNPSDFQNCGDNCPVNNVNWNDAKEFIQKLNARTGKQYRLPSEAEWEYACGAGARQAYCGSDDEKSVAWNYDNSDHEVRPVAQKRPNSWGLYDMSGNVEEWLEDSWHDNYDGAPDDGSAWQGDGAERAVRSTSIRQHGSRAVYRDSYKPTKTSYAIGFRLARTLP